MIAGLLYLAKSQVLFWASDGGASGRKNNAFDTMTDGEERTAFDIDSDAVDRAQKIVASLADESLLWLSADIDEIENSLPEADKNPQRVNQLARKAHDIRGQGVKVRFPFGSASGRWSSSRDGLTRRAAEPRRRGSDAWIVCCDADYCPKGGRRASGTRRRAKPPMTQFFKSKFLMTDRDAEYH